MPVLSKYEAAVDPRFSRSRLFRWVAPPPQTFRREPRLKRGPNSSHRERLQLDDRRLLLRLVSSMHALRRRVAGGKAGGKADTLAGDQRFCHLLSARVANAAHKPSYPIKRFETLFNVGSLEFL